MLPRSTPRFLFLGVLLSSAVCQDDVLEALELNESKAEAICPVVAYGEYHNP